MPFKDGKPFRKDDGSGVFDCEGTEFSKASTVKDMINNITKLKLRLNLLSPEPSGWAVMWHPVQ